MRVLASLVSIGLCLFACASPPTSEIRVSGHRIFLPATVNGSPVEALLDSGAEMTLVDADAATRFGLVAQGTDEARGTGANTVEVQFAEGVDIEAVDTRLDDMTIVILDLEDIATRVVGEPVTMVLGRELFDAGRYFLDIENGRFHKVPAEFEPTGQSLPLSDANGIKQIPVRINGEHDVLADFDLGNGTEVLLSEDFAREAGLLVPENIIGTREGGGLGGPVELTLVRVDSLTIAGVDLHDLVVAVSPSVDGSDANIGVSVLRQFEMVIDFPGNRLWIGPRS